MEAILDSVRRIVSRWSATRIQITSDIEPGDTIIPVWASHRFRVGDEVMIHTATQGEVQLTIEEIPTDTSIVLSTPVKFHWKQADNLILEKTFNQMYVQGVYVGEPENIPRYPAITVNAISRDSEWLTIDSTKETYNLQLTVYVEDSMQEAGYRFLLKMVDTIQYGLKQNIYPLVGDYNVVSLIADGIAGDQFIKVSDTSSFEFLSRIFIEDAFSVEERRVLKVIDSQTLQIADPGICQTWLVSNNTQVVNVLRHIYNSWPSNIDFGKIFKGTMLKAATINWFAWEEER